MRFRERELEQDGIGIQQVAPDLIERERSRLGERGVARAALADRCFHIAIFEFECANLLLECDSGRAGGVRHREQA